MPKGVRCLVGVLLFAAPQVTSAAVPPLLCSWQDCRQKLAHDEASWNNWGKTLQPGEWAQTAELDIGPGDYANIDDPPCADASGPVEPNVLVGAAVAKVAALAISNPALAVAASALFTPHVSAAIRGSGGDLGFLLEPHRYSACTVVSVLVPAKASVVRVFYEGYDKVGGGPCYPPDRCAGGWSRFAGEAAVSRDQGYQVVSAVFKNWSGGKDGRTRTPKIIVVFRPPTGWTP